MINKKDQEQLLKLISNYLEDDVSAYAIGGTAMMFSNYKNTTKDIDIVFKDQKSRKTFIDAIENLGYKKRSLKSIYDKKREENKNKPLMYSRGEERFDLFVKSIFGFELDFSEFIERHDFIGKKELNLFVPRFEIIILLKAITDREKDLEDIKTIIKIEKDVDWDFLIDEAVKQKKSLEWVLIDLEETLQKLKTITFIKEKFFKKLYDAQFNG